MACSVKSFGKRVDRLADHRLASAPFRSTSPLPVGHIGTRINKSSQTKLPIHSVATSRIFGTDSFLQASLSEFDNTVNENPAAIW
jgi:hypothetical protein